MQNSDVCDTLESYIAGAESACAIVGRGGGRRRRGARRRRRAAHAAAHDGPNGAAHSAHAAARGSGQSWRNGPAMDDPAPVASTPFLTPVHCLSSALTS